MSTPRRHHDDRPTPRLRALPALFAGAAACAAVLTTPEAALAQCDAPDTVFCAEVRIGARRRPPRRAQQPRVIVVQPAPPPPPPPPAPRVVVVQPAPPPPPPPPRRQVVVVTTRTTTTPAPTPVVTPAPPAPRIDYPGSATGLRLFFGAAGIPDGGMGGGGAALRLRPASHFGIDLGVGIYGGRDADERLRGELPITADLRFIFNGTRRFQVYGILGGGVSFANVEELDGRQREFVHVGGSLGLGMEFFVAPKFALSWDVRAFLRQAVDSSDGEPEFVDEANGEATDTSAGGLATFGATFYF